MNRSKRFLTAAWLLWAIFVILVLLFWKPNTEIPTSEPTATTRREAAIQSVPVVQVVHKTASAPIVIEYDTAPEATEPIDFDPTRGDIPMDADTQVLLYQACGDTGLQFELALAVVWKESRFQNINGDNGNSIGYMQVQPRWHSDRMERLGVADLADPYGNFLVGCDYLAEMIAKDRGIEWALMAYNGGPVYANYMAEAGNISPYARDVINYMNDLEEMKNGELEF